MNRWIQRSFKRARRRRQLIWYAVVALAGVFMIVSVVRLIGYYGEKGKDERNTEEMRVAATTPVPTSTTDVSTTPEALPNSVAETEKLVENGQLIQAEYGDPGSDAPDRPDFTLLRNRYPDVIGWLKIEGEIDEPVVQRDNEFYLDHDASGKKNINGALFLDAIVDLKTRPYSLIIYGHNMRSGAKFGNLYRYEENSYFAAHRVISFDTIYENGTYEVFAAGVFKADELDIFFLNTLDVWEREEMIERLRENAVLDSGVDVGVTDQVLFMITCVDDDAKRRFVAAKRVE